ncbi:hypothetical protein HYR99_06230 [Candidatus Poribacteria bacterium]|nr:hypothetical protein [Candidatus Poribacteria bacterium]
MDTFWLFLWGIFGGIVGEGLVWYNLAKRKPDDLSHLLPQEPIYWVIIAGRILVGGILVVAYLRSGISIQPILAIHVGITTPAIVGSLASQAPSISPGSSDSG